MKFWILGIGLCLLTATELTAQYRSLPREQKDDSETQWLLTLARERSLYHSNTADRSIAQPNGDDVISLQGLAHKVDKRARKLAEKGMREYSQGRYAESLSSLQRAVSIDSQSAVLQNNLGVIYCALGRDEEAQQAFKRAVQADSSAVASYINLSAVAFDNDRYSLAEASARQALRIAPRSPGANVMLVLCHVWIIG